MIFIEHRQKEKLLFLLTDVIQLQIYPLYYIAKGITKENKVISGGKKFSQDQKFIFILSKYYEIKKKKKKQEKISRRKNFVAKFMFITV